MHRVIVVRGLVNRLCIRYSMFDVRCSMFSVIFLDRHQFHAAFRTFAGVVLHNFGMHYAGVLGGFRFRSLRQERRYDRRH
jgi:hypothetical protein